MADRQKYNFLTALVRQVKGAAHDGDEVYEEWCALVGPPADGVAGADEAVSARFDDHAQWLASIEARLEDLEQAVELLAGEEADCDDDGDDDEDMRGHEPRLGGDVGNAGRVPANLAGARDRPVAGRTVMDVDRSRTYKKVGCRKATVTRG